MRRPLRRLLIIAVAAALVAAGWWAGRTALVPPENPLAGPEPVTYQVVEGTVGRSLGFAAQAEWTLSPLGTSWASGIVTSIDAAPGDLVQAGDVLFAVGLRPVTVAEGSTPSFRDLGLKARGPDVAQLQELLTTLGFYEGEIDGVYGNGLRTAVKAWQKTLSVTDDGAVRAGDLVYVPRLPARVVLDEAVAVGRRLNGGETTVWLLPDAPAFWIPLGPEQRSLVPLSADVQVTYRGGTWAAKITDAIEDRRSNQLILHLAAADGGPVCADECAEKVPLIGTTDFPVEIVVAPERTGPVVPAAALGTAADGSAFVTLPDGTTRTVTLLAVAYGLAVVDGVEVGETLVLPFERPPDQS